MPRPASACARLPLRPGAHDAARRSSRRSRRRKIGVLLINLGTPDAPDAQIGAALSRRIPVRPPRRRDPAARSGSRSCAASSSTRGRRSRRMPMGWCGARTARRSPRSPRAQAAALQGAFGAGRDGRLGDALRQSGDRRAAAGDEGCRVRAHPARAALSAILRRDDRDRQRQGVRRAGGDALAAGDAHAAALSRRSAPISPRSRRRSRRALAALDFAPDAIVASFHGMPQRTLELGDPYHCHCQKTARLLGEALGRELIVTFQSRFGRAKWLEPATDTTLAALPGKGVKQGRDRRAGLLRRLPRDAGGTGDPRARELRGGGRHRISPICRASTTARSASRCCAASWRGSLKAGCALR